MVKNLQWGLVFFLVSSVFAGDSIFLFKKQPLPTQQFLIGVDSIDNRTSLTMWIRPDSIDHPTTFTRLYEGRLTENIAHKTISVSSVCTMRWDLELSQDTTLFQGLIRYDLRMLSRNEWIAEVALIKRIQHTDTFFTDLPVITRIYTGKRSKNPICLSTNLILRNLQNDPMGFSSINVTCKKLKKYIFRS